VRDAASPLPTSKTAPGAKALTLLTLEGRDSSESRNEPSKALSNRSAVTLAATLLFWSRRRGQVLCLP